MLPYVAEEFQIRYARGPVGVVDDAGGIALHLEIEETGELRLLAFDVVGDLFRGLEVAFVRFSRGVAYHPCGAARQGDRVVACELEATEGQQRHKVAEMKAVGRRIEAGIEDDGARADAPGQGRGVGAVGE